MLGYKASEIPRNEAYPADGGTAITRDEAYPADGGTAITRDEDNAVDGRSDSLLDDPGGKDQSRVDLLLHFGLRPERAIPGDLPGHDLDSMAMAGMPSPASCSPAAR